MSIRLTVDQTRLEAFCRKWNVTELSVFGSAVRDDFRPDSDVDILVSLDEHAHCGLFEWVDMIDELKEIFGREVDLVEKEAMRNPFRRRMILNNREILYAAR